MQINSSHVGAACKPLDVEVALRSCMNYAASIGDDNPRHLDDARPEGIVAPPMFAIALTWRISEHFAEHWGGADFPYEALARQVHYSESLQWFRPMRPGDRLRIEGTVAAILPHRAGTHLILEYAARTPQGDLVFIERIGGLLRGVKCADDGRGEDIIPARTCSDDAAPRWEKVLPISKLAAHIYDGMADVHFPIHISPAFAKMVGLPGIIFQGTGAMAMAVREITATEADNNPERIRAAHCRFTGMIRPDSEIALRVMDKQDVEMGSAYYFTVFNAQGKRALSDGCVVVASA